MWLVVNDKYSQISSRIIVMINIQLMDKNSTWYLYSIHKVSTFHHPKKGKKTKETKSIDFAEPHI